MREIRLICKKELSRVLTDRKMLFSVFLLPAIIMVVVMNVMTSFSENLERSLHNSTRFLELYAFFRIFSHFSEKFRMLSTTQQRKQAHT